MSWLGAVFFLKLRLRVTRNAERLARGQLAELHFWILEQCFHTSQTAKTFSSFTVISLVDAREGSFPFRSRFEKVLKFCPLAEKRGSLEVLSDCRLEATDRLADIYMGPDNSCSATSMYR